jgi:hypothetical protein
MGMNVGLQKCKERKELNLAKCIAGADVRCIRREYKFRELNIKNKNK